MKQILTDLPLRTYASLPEGKPEQAGVFFTDTGLTGRICLISAAFCAVFPESGVLFSGRSRRAGIFRRLSMVFFGRI